MVPIEKGKDQPTFEEVQELFAVWRNQKKRRDPIPPALWERALHLVEHYSINTIAKHLRLNYNELKIRRRGLPRHPRPQETISRLHRACRRLLYVTDFAISVICKSLSLLYVTE
jgi:hypothetical protein